MVKHILPVVAFGFKVILFCTIKQIQTFQTGSD